MKDLIPGFIQALTDEKYIIVKFGSASIVTNGGGTLVSYLPPKREEYSIHTVRADSKGRRVALLLIPRHERRWFNHSETVPYTINVMDTEEMRIISSIPLGVSDTHSEYDLDFALSPDGHELALVSGGVLKIYSE